MALQFIIGNSGSGKSHILYERIIAESMEHPEKNYMVIVPEQFTMQTQKDLVMMHPRKGIMNIDVLSFRRLAHRIFEEVGADRRTVLTETGKNLMLRKVANLEKDRLQILGDRMNRPGYVSEVKSIMSEMMQYEITDFEFQEMLKFTEKRPLLHTKLEDLQILYQSFLEYQRERFMKPEELMDVLCQVAGRSELLKNSTLAFDGFTGFTPSQMKVMEELFHICPKIWITVTIDARENFFGEIQEHELFALSKKMIRSLMEAAKRSHYPVEEPIILGKKTLPRFQKGGALEHLEQNLFRNRSGKYTGKTEELSIHVSPSPADEVHFTARQICSLVREENLRYQDIAVITGDPGSYNHYVKHVFPMYEIPAFLDETRQILLNPCLEFVRGALTMIEKDFSIETVFRFLRTGMIGFLPEEIDQMENYVLAAGIRGIRMWEKDWDRLPQGIDLEQLEILNQYRERLAEKILPFTRRMKQKQMRLQEYADALYELLVSCAVQQKLKDREVLLLQQGAREEAKEYSQIYSLLIQLLDEMVDLMGEESVSGKEFGEILDAGFSEAKVGLIPPGIDQVQVGDITRTRLAHVKVLFFLGLNDGWVPQAGGSGGIVSDLERELLQESGVELAPSARENSYTQRFYLYQNLTKPKKHLYLSWCSSSGDGTAMRPSYLVGIIQRMYPDLQVRKEEKAGSQIRQITSRENGMLYLTENLQKIRTGNLLPEWMELYRTYLQDTEYKESVNRLLQAAFLRGSKMQLTYQTSRELYGEVMTNSVTRLEQFAACAFAHFASYGLHLSERQMYGVKPTDLGIIFHRAMELYSRRLENSEYDWTNIPKEEQIHLVERCVEDVTKEYGAGVLRNSARDAYTITRIKRILGRTVWALNEQIRSGSFVPTGFEVSFKDIGNLESVHVKFGESGKINLKGQIDRIDTAYSDNEIYVKIIDYKSGQTKFDPVSIYYGLQLQLVVYLNAALEMEQKQNPGKEIIPAGIFYYHLDDPVLDKELGNSDKETEEKLLKSLRPDGVLNQDEAVLQLLDPHMGGESLVIPAGRKKDGSLKAASSAVSTEQFGQLSRFVIGKMQEMAEQISQGDVTALPYSTKDRTACDYCDFADVCGFDRKIPGMCMRKLQDMKKDEVWKRIAEECDDGSEMDE